MSFEQLILSLLLTEVFRVLLLKKITRIMNLAHHDDISKFCRKASCKC